MSFEPLSCTMYRSHLRTALLSIGCILAHVEVTAQLNVGTTFTPAALVNDILVGQGITVSNLTFNGEPANVVNDRSVRSTEPIRTSA